MAQKDLTTKTLESYNEVFADIVNVLLFNGKRLIEPDRLVSAQKDSHYKADGKIYSQERDVSKFWQNANINIALLGVENQVAVDELMPLRIFSYDGAEYRNQYRLKKNGKLKNCYPVITLVLYFGSENWNYSKNLCSCFEVPDGLEKFVNDYKMNFYAVKDMTDADIEKFTSDFRVIAEFFNALLNKKSYHPTNRRLEHPEEVIDMISVFSGDERFRNEYNSMSEKGGITMCEIYDKILRQGEEKGIEKGIEKGKAEGILMTLVSLVKKGLLTISQAAEEAQMSVEEFKLQSGLIG